MDYDSASSCEDRLLDLEGSNPRKRTSNHKKRHSHSHPAPYKEIPSTSSQSGLPRASVKIIERSLSSQVMEYYHRYSQTTNLDRYFSMPDSNFSNEAYKSYLKPDGEKPWENFRKSTIEPERSSLKELPRERRRWVRPPLIGQPSGASSELLSSAYQDQVPDSAEVTPEPEDKPPQDEIISEERLEQKKENMEVDIKATSPTSSITSHKPLEWDSGADVGYHNLPRNKSKERNMLCTIERMALARGLCSAALRLDPEGTTGSTVDSVTQNNSPSRTRGSSKPDAHSTKINDDVSCSDAEVLITPIVKANLSGIIAGKIVGSSDPKVTSNVTHDETPRTSKSKYATEKFKDMNLMKKSMSMNVLAMPLALGLKRSQSELNLTGKEGKKKDFPLNFASSSSIATIINKPLTCDKDIQTNLSQETAKRESIGIQVSVIADEKRDSVEVPEEKPPLPKRVSSLSQNLQSILKTSDNSSLSKSRSGRSDEGTDAGRASNSFEYFPGHVYQNVRASSPSHVSSVDTGRSQSTMPNTSSSLDEKLWGDSDSLLRDLERSLNILKSLVDANKCDKHVKKRLIHHVIKRLVNAKYTDDKIERELEENVPWNPDDARNKIYRNEIIQALVDKQKNTTEESSEDWHPRKSKKIDRKSIKEMIQLIVSSENSDLFEGRNTDRTDAVQDGRKARMGLRNDERHGHKLNKINLDTEKSESSECFLPQKMTKNDKNDGKIGTSSTNTEERVRVDDKINWRLPATMSERRFELERCNYRGANTRLIDYVEMEKKNQLVWINNEINHLSNLKKLLEEPKRYRERKTEDFSGSLDQWSSHGNLAKRDKTSRKRNSCTQTGVGDKGFSKSDGAEIIAAVEGLLRDEGRDVSDAYAQTVTPESSRVPSPESSWSPRRNCLVHGNKKGVCQCRRPDSSSSGDKNEGRGSEGVGDTKKETKNRMNDKCRSEINVGGDEGKGVGVKGRGRGHCRGCRCNSAENSGISGEKERDAMENGGKKGGTGECTCDEGREEKRREVKSCRTCGTVYASVNKKCQCTLTYVKPIAYELSFKEERTRSARSGRDSKGEDDVQSKNSEVSRAPAQPQLKDYLTKNKPEFVDNVETRKRYMSEISQLRQLKKEKRMQLLAIASPSSLIVSPRNYKPIAKSQRKINDEELKMRLRLRYLRLNEVRNKRKQKEKEEQAKRNHLMAKIFCKKLQQKVLNGQVDLSQSVSVISNL